MRHLESQIQQSCVKWFTLQFPRLRPLLFAVPNGGARNRIEAGIMKGEGVTAGVADMLLLYPNRLHHGLCIEFKTPKGRQQDSQKRWQRFVELAGYRYCIVRSFEEFQKLIFDYLDPKK